MTSTKHQFTTKIRLILSIYGDHLIPNELTESTGMIPTDAWLKGEQIPNRRVGLIRKESAWQYDTGYIETLDFEEVAEPFINTLEDKLELIEDYIKCHDADIASKIYVIIEIADERTPGVVLSNRFLTLAYRLNAWIDMGLHVLSSKSDEA